MHFNSTHGCLNATTPVLALVSGVTAAPTYLLLIAVFKRLSADRRKNDTDAVEATLMPQGRFLLLLPYRSPYRLRSSPVHRTSNLKTSNICASLLTAISMSVLTNGKSAAMSLRGLGGSQDKARGRSRRARRHLVHRRGWRDERERRKKVEPSHPGNSRSASESTFERRGRLDLSTRALSVQRMPEQASNSKRRCSSSTGALSLTLQHPATCNCSQVSSRLTSSTQKQCDCISV